MINKDKYYNAIHIINVYERRVRRNEFVSVQDKEQYDRAREVEDEYWKGIDKPALKD